jgi:Holliday junction resolvase RusA-like endonuclease
MERSNEKKRCKMVLSMKHKAVYNLFIRGKPVAQPRTRKGKYGNIYNPHTADTWKEIIQVNILAAGRKETITKDVCLEIIFYFYAPEKLHKASPHIIKPDIDNLEKSVMDALKGIGIYKDDCQVCTKFTRKYWTNKKEDEGMSIKVIGVIE